MATTFLPEGVEIILERSEKDWCCWPCIFATASVTESPMAMSLDRSILKESGVSTGPQNGHAGLVEARDKSKQRVEHAQRDTVSKCIHMIDNWRYFWPIIEQILQ